MIEKAEFSRLNRFDVWWIYRGKPADIDIDCIRHFPEDLFPAPKDQEAILPYGTCGDAVSSFDDIVRTLLKGRCSGSYFGVVAAGKPADRKSRCLL